MTDKEALNELKNSIKGDGYQCHKETYEVAIEALEKRIPKKPIRLRNFNDLRCPICKGYIETETDEFECCPCCGQAIDWSKQDK